MSLRLISASRLDAPAFAAQSLLGQSLQHPAHVDLPRTIHTSNSQGLPELYNQALHRCNEEILLFCHDDLALPPEPLEPLLRAQLEPFAIVGLAGNSRDCHHLAWHLRPDGNGWDFPYLRGAISSGTLSAHRKDVYGLTNTPVQLIDGVLIAVQRQQLLDHGVQFDPYFRFHFYDLDLCRSARSQGLSIGVIRLPCIHGSGGQFGSEVWRQEAERFCTKWQQSFRDPFSQTTAASALQAQDQAPAAFQRGRSAYRAKRYAEAQEAFTEAVQEAPDYAWSWLQLANSQRHQGDIDAAITTLQQLTAQIPSSSDGWRNLALLHQQQADWPAVRQALERLVAIQPQQPDRIGLLADLLIQRQAFDDAESLLRAATHALGSDPKAKALWQRLGQLLLQRGERGKAFKALHNASLLDPADATTALAKAALLLEAGQPEAALATVNALLQQQPHHVAALQRKAEILQFMGELEESLRLCRQALQQEPERLELMLLEIYACQALCDWQSMGQQLNAIIRRLEQRDAPSDTQAVGAHEPLPPFGLLTLPLPTELLRQELDRWVLANGQLPPADHQPRLPAVHGQRRPLRIGYLSADFRSHAMGLLLEGLFEAHDPNESSTFAYSISPIHDLLTEHYRNTADHFHDLHRQSNSSAIEQIQTDQLDLLIDLTGLTTFSRPAIVCARPAPLILNYLGFPGSQGAHYVDGILADAQLIPNEQESAYSEQAWRLPHAFASRWRQPMAGISRSSLGLPEEAILLCCFNRAEKITANTFSSWMTILQEVPGSVLWLAVQPPALQRLQAHAQARGVDPHRLVTAPYQKPVERFLAAMACADLFLDTAGFNAGAIGVLALNAGLPLLTIAGDRFCNRMGASLCHAVNQPELMTTSQATYQQKAIELATTPGAIRRLKAQLRTEPQSLPLFQQRRWVRDLIATFSNQPSS